LIKVDSEKLLCFIKTWTYFQSNGEGNVKCNTIEATHDTTNTVGFGGNSGLGVNGCPTGYENQHQFKLTSIQTSAIQS
jgi:hypothetical protein